MNPALKGIWENIRHLGLGALTHANHHAAFSPAPDTPNTCWSELSVLQAAHAAELLIKARIAQEHPLLIFEQLPRAPINPGDRLEFEDLFLNGRTIQWSELPSRLWATTGLSIPNKAKFDAFGKIRNGFQHFGAGTNNPSDETLRFIYEVIDPFINQSWGLFAVDYDEDYEPYIYFVIAMVHSEILFLVSPESASHFEHWNVDWKQVSARYRTEMYKRVKNAKKIEKTLV